MATIFIGCRLPHGLKLRHPNPEVQVEVTLAGYHSNKLVNRDGSPAANFAVTEVDADFWEIWKTAYRTYKPLLSGAIFEARTAQVAEAKGRELRKEKTGFEPMLPDSLGVKKADK